MDELSFRLVDSIEQIGQQTWAAIVGTSMPFMRYEFLSALESSGAVSAKTGWKVQHLQVMHQQDVVALMPLYEKYHSYGEYVFDWAWAEAYERNGLEYYPKLVNAVPFTPVIASKFAIAKHLDDEQQQQLVSELVNFITGKVSSGQYSGWHSLFITPQLLAQYQSSALIARLGTQFHWCNRNYHHFDDFLAAMTSRKRKNIRKERQCVAKHNLSFVMLAGEQITANDWQAFYHCYMHTYLKRSGHSGYLNQAFFQTLGRTMPENVRLLMVYQHSDKPVEDSSENTDAELIAAALFFVSDTHLYGRYWGALKEIDGLHFETCYYQGIDYAINQNLQVFDAGAQGEHKVLRGFEPVAMHSVHYIEHQAFSTAIEDFCGQERHNMAQYMSQLDELLPYREPAKESD